MVPLIKGMLARGDNQSDIAAWFGINSGRVAEINTGERSPEVKLTTEDLPPANLPSPHELWKANQALCKARVALEGAREKIDVAILAVSNAEGRIKS